MLTTVADFQEGLFALTAVAGHLIFYTPAASPHTETRQPGRAGRVSRQGGASESPLAHAASNADCGIVCGRCPASLSAMIFAFDQEDYGTLLYRNFEEHLRALAIV